MATGDGVFGQGATFNSDVGFDLAISPDKKAFTAGFGGLTVSLNAVSIPIVMRTLTLRRFGQIATWSNFRCATICSD
jgi:hypothetical protein